VLRAIFLELLSTSNNDSRSAAAITIALEACAEDIGRVYKRAI
jgi:hypothetical protein